MQWKPEYSVQSDHSLEFPTVTQLHTVLCQGCTLLSSYLHQMKRLVKDGSTYEMTRLFFWMWRIPCFRGFPQPVNWWRSPGAKLAPTHRACISLSSFVINPNSTRHFKSDCHDLLPSLDIRAWRQIIEWAKLSLTWASSSCSSSESWQRSKTWKTEYIVSGTRDMPINATHVFVAVRPIHLLGSPYCVHSSIGSTSNLGWLQAT